MAARHPIHYDRELDCHKIVTPHGDILFDTDDLPRVSVLAWRSAEANTQPGVFYAKSGTREQKRIMMHRFILGVTDPLVTVDHINHNTLDNRKANLRKATRGEQAINRRPWGQHSRFAGVSRDAYGWRAQVQSHGQIAFRRMFKDEIEAAICRDAYARVFHGERAYLNFRDEKEIPADYLPAYRRYLKAATAAKK